MNISYLNGQFVPLAEAKISPLDRGFLFGDGIYEFIPYYGGRSVGFRQHIDRMGKGLKALGIRQPHSLVEWKAICDRLLSENTTETAGVYLQITRGADTKRSHGFPKDITPTVFGLLAEIPAAVEPDRKEAAGIRVISDEDKRWRRCNLKSTALLGNVLHFQHALDRGFEEVLLYNVRGELTEGAASNVFVVRDGVVVTPPLDEEKLPGINRQLILDLLRADGTIPVEEDRVTMEEVRLADEIWFCNSSFGVKAVVQLDEEKVSGGKPGPVWEKAARLYEAGKFAY